MSDEVSRRISISGSGCSIGRYSAPTRTLWNHGGGGLLPPDQVFAAGDTVVHEHWPALGKRTVTKILKNGWGIKVDGVAIALSPSVLKRVEPDSAK